jgi:hypothetical protein
MHKIFNRADCPWVDLIWNNYYSNGSLPSHKPKGSFWWRAVLKLMDKFKGMAMVHVQNGSSVLLWFDMWENKVRYLQEAELFSFSIRKDITLKQARQMEHLHENFQLPVLNCFPAIPTYKF